MLCDIDSSTVSVARSIPDQNSREYPQSFYSLAVRIPGIGVMTAQIVGFRD